MDYEAVIGLEVHVQLRTETKMFCRCPNRYGGEPNTRVCPVCLGYPGALPKANLRAVELAARLALALGCEVRHRSVFARKSYFYPDLPKGYQISQHEKPLARGGAIPLSWQRRSIPLRRLHLEEDAGKMVHGTGDVVPKGEEGSRPPTSRVDFNRCGVPLVEIVTEPRLSSPEEAQDCLKSLHRAVLYTESSDGSLEEGSLRCDANISLRPRGAESYGNRVEIKNLNSFRFVAKALEHEIHRQRRRLEMGREIEEETRSFDPRRGVTHRLRSKEEAMDYRYFPDPDLPPLRIPLQRLERLGEELPPLPWERQRWLEDDLGLPAADARLISSERRWVDYFAATWECLEAPAAAADLAAWFGGDLLRVAREREQDPTAGLPAEDLADLLRLVATGTLSRTAAKTVLEEVWGTGEAPEAAMERLQLSRVSDPLELAQWARQAVREHPEQAAQYRGGKLPVLGFFVGQALALSGGRADPQQLAGALRDALTEETGDSSGAGSATPGPGEAQ